MITEMLSSACVILLVVVICCIIKLHEIIRPSGNEKTSESYAGENQRALPVVREPRAEESAGQHGKCNCTTYGGLQAMRRQPKMHDERFGW